MIRPATQDDLELLVQLSTEFNDTYYFIPFNRDKARAALSTAIDEHVVLISEHGFIMGTLVDAPFHDRSILVETAWYAKKDGLRFLRQFVDIGRAAGADEVRICTLTVSNERVGALLNRLGFDVEDTSHRLLL